MNRRDAVRQMVLASSAGLAVSALGASPATGVAGPQRLQAASKSQQALSEMIAVLERKATDFHSPAWRLHNDNAKAEARLMLLNCINHAMDVWMPMDPARPYFMRFNFLGKKVLGDNADAIYYETLVDPQYEYEIRGNVSGATYSSFTVELEKSPDGASKLGATLNDTEFKTDADGNYRIIVSAKKPLDANVDWLKLDKAAISIATRSYFEYLQSVGRDQTKHVLLAIERLDDPGPPPAPSDESVARGIRRATLWLDQHIIQMDDSRSPHWVSRVPNQFVPPKVDNSNESIGYAAKDNTYAMAPWFLQKDEALLIRGRFPKCRFASIALWNQFMQTLDYRYRQTSLNRLQTTQGEDGEFTMILAHEDPGQANWLYTEGRPLGIMFWRFQLVEDELQAIETEVVKFKDIAKTS